MMMQCRPSMGGEVRIDTGSRRPYFRKVYFVAAFIIAVILFMPGSISAEEGFGVLGVEFPVMVDNDWLLDSDEVPFSTFHLKLDLKFYLSPEGTVDSFTYSPDSRQVYIDRISNSLKNIRFYPARINDTAVSFTLPAELLFWQWFGKRHADLRLPYNEPECHKSEVLIEKALKLGTVEVHAESPVRACGRY